MLDTELSWLLVTASDRDSHENTRMQTGKRNLRQNLSECVRFCSCIAATEPLSPVLITKAQGFRRP